MGIAPYKYFTFDGESSRNYDVYLTGTGVFNAPQRAVDLLEIPGRNGNYALDQGRFNNITVTYKAGIVDYSESDFADKVSAVRNWLCSKVGYVRLTDDYNPDEYRMAVFKNGITVDHDDLKTGEFDITFECKPQRWLTSGETPIEIGAWGDTQTVSGDIAQFSALETDKVKSLVADIEPVQKGTPWQSTTEEQEPYLSRSIPNVGHSVNSEFDTLVGGSVAWNQLVQNGNFADTSNWSNSASTFSVSSNVATITTTNNWGRIQQKILDARQNGHKFLFCVDIKASGDNVGKNVRCGVGKNDTSDLFFLIKTLTSSWQTLATIRENTFTTEGYFSVGGANNVVTFDARNAQCLNLTQMFGATIADYIYTLEQNNAGDGVAFFRKYFPEDYYAYDSGSIQSVEATAHKTYDSNNTLIGNYALDSDLVLRGIPKLDANNKLYYDGDTYESDGTVTRKYGIVDLGSLSWQKWTTSGDHWRFVATQAGVKWSATTQTAPNAICSVYDTTTPSATYAGTKGITIAQNIDEILICDENYSTKDSLTTYLSGKYFIYELATPTTESADPYTNPQEIVTNGKEEYTSNSVVPVGHKSRLADIYPISGWSGVDVDVNGTTISVSWSGDAGTVYGGTVDVVSGELTVDKVSITIDGNSNIQTNGTTAGASKFFYYVPNKANGTSNMFSDRFEVNNTTDFGTMWGRAGNNGVEFNLPTSVAQTVAAGQAWFSNNPTQVCYELATPTTYTLTEQQVDLLVGQNTVFADTGDVTVEYGQNPMVLINPTPFDASPLLAVKGYGNIDMGGQDIEIENVPMGEIVICNEEAESKQLSRTVKLDVSNLNSADSFTINCVFRINHHATTYVYITGLTIGTETDCSSYYDPVSNKLYSLFITPTNTTFAKGTSATKTCSVVHTVSVSGNNTTRTVTCSVAYDGDETLTLSASMTSITNVTTRKWARMKESTGYSTKSALGNPLYIDLDVGEAWNEDGAEPVSCNNAVALGSDLPILPPGATTFTYDGTVTELKVTPRWWKV